MGMTPRLKTVSNLPLGSPEYDRTSARNFKWGLPPASNPKWLEKGHYFDGMTRRIKTVIDGGILVHETVLQVNSKSTCAVMARDRLVKMCSSCGEQIPLATRQVSLTID